jgi:peptidoglycan/LPS O-acetylase OafA/YrhL
VLGVCWTLWVEIRFYALFALCVVLPGANRRRVIMFCAGWTLAAAIAQAARQPLLDLVLMPEYAPFFIGGIGLYLVHRDRRDAYAWGIVLVSFLIGQRTPSPTAPPPASSASSPSASWPLPRSRWAG